MNGPRQLALEVPFGREAWIEQHLPASLGALGNREIFRKTDFIPQAIKGPNAGG